jgi:oligopeptidase B
MNPPIAKKIPKDVGVHGDKRVDDYFWMRERDSADVIAYLEEENAYTEAMMARSRSLRAKLFGEIVGRIKETDASVPAKLGDYLYYSRTEEGKQYSIHCRRKDSPGAGEEIILDENELAEGQDYFSIGAFRLSPDHNLLALSIDTSGSESHTLYVKDLATGRLLGEKIPDTYYGVEWANDNRTLFYNKLDPALRPYRLFRHRLGTPTADDALIYQENDDRYFLGLSKTKSRRFITMELASNTTTEVHYLNADRPEDTLRLIHPRQHQMEYRVTHNGEWFYILTNDGAKNFRVVKAPAADPSKANWKNVVRHRKYVKIDRVEAFEKHLVVYERANGLKKIRVIDLSGGGNHYVRFPEPVCTFSTEENPEYRTNLLRFSFTSLVTPRSVIDYNMDTRERELRKQYEVLGGFDRDRYHTKRVFAVARDGAKIPISLVYRRDTPRDGSAPLFLFGYGAYGSSVEPEFLSHRLSMLDRGFVCAQAHVRGGGEMGREWYEQGKLLKKTNTFTDYIACAQHLVRRKYTSAGKIAGYGGSAGGLLVGTVANKRPELFQCIVASVPFVDVVTTMLDEAIPLTVTEFEEWGNPEQKNYYEYIRKYSPYDNVERKDYPHMLVTAGLNDPRVQYWEPAKWVAKLRALKTDDNVLLLQTKMDEGHGGASGRYDRLHDIAFEYAFILHCFGISD